MATRKSKPWAVICTTPGQPIRTEHTSEAKAYEKVNAERLLANSGASRVTRIRVEQWDRDAGRWTLFDHIDPKES
jgi:hypothetical protein